MKTLVFCIGLFFINGLIISSNNTFGTNQGKPSTYIKVNIDIKVYQTNELVTKSDGKTERGWCYDIYLDNKLYIHQPYIPAINGNHYFRSEADARKTADLTVIKIRKNIMPPAISIHELDSLGVREQ